MITRNASKWPDCGRIEAILTSGGTLVYFNFKAATFKGKESGRYGRPTSFPSFLVKWPYSGARWPVWPDCPPPAVVSSLYSRPLPHHAHSSPAQPRDRIARHNGPRDRKPARNGCARGYFLRHVADIPLMRIAKFAVPDRIAHPAVPNFPPQWPSLRPLELLTFRQWQRVHGHAAALGRPFAGQPRPVFRRDPSRSADKSGGRLPTGGPMPGYARICPACRFVRWLTHTPYANFLMQKNFLESRNGRP